MTFEKSGRMKLNRSIYPVFLQLGNDDNDAEDDYDDASNS
jgi:hypothetical protein